MIRFVLVLALALVGCGVEPSHHTRSSSEGSAAFGGGAFGGGSRGGQTTVTLYNRDFRLNQSALSTPTLPPNTSAANSVAQCRVTSGTTMACTKPDGSTFSVAQGTTPIAATDPLGFIDRDDTTTANSPALTTASDFGTAYTGIAHTTIGLGYGTFHTTGAGGVLPLWAITPGVGTTLNGRGKGVNSAPLWDCNYGASTAESNGGPLDGLGLFSCDFTGAAINAYSSGWTATAALASVTYTSGGTYRFFNDSSNNLQGLGGIVQLFTGDKSTSVLTGYLQQYAGLVADTQSPIAFHRPSPQWLVDANGRAWKYSGGDSVNHVGGMPVITSRGAELQPGGVGVRPQHNGMVNGQAIGNSLASLTAIGTPTLTTGTKAGPFYDYAIGAPVTKECGLVVDDDGAAFEGYKGSIAPGDNETTAGEYVVSGYFSAGTSGTTTTKVTLGIVTDATATAACPSAGQIPSGLTCAVSGGTCTYSGLTTSVQRAFCPVAVSGSPTSIRGEILVGGVGTDTGSTTVCQYQAGAGAGYVAPIADNAAMNADYLYVPKFETASWPNGETSTADIEIAFTPDFDLPSEAGLDTTSIYLLSTNDGVSAEIKLIMLQVGAIGDGHVAHDVLVRSGWRSQPGGTRSAVCTSGSFGNGGTDITSPGTLGAITAGEQLVVRLRVVPAGTLAGVPRVNQFMYFDRCTNAATCHATTLVASNTSGTMCAGDSSDLEGMINGRSSGATFDLATSQAPVAIARLTVKETL